MPARSILVDGPGHRPELDVIHEQRCDDLHGSDTDRLPGRRRTGDGRCHRSGRPPVGSGDGRCHRSGRATVMSGATARRSGEQYVVVRCPTPSTRDLILEEAKQCFANQGYEGTSLNDIAAGVGIRRPSLLHYFDVQGGDLPPDPPGRADRLGPRAPGRARGAAGRLGAGRQDPRGQLRLLPGNNPEIVSIVRREALDEKGHLGFDLGAALRPYFLRAVAFFEREMDAGRFRRHDPGEPGGHGLRGPAQLLLGPLDAQSGLLNRDPLAEDALEARFEHIRSFVRAALEPEDDEPLESPRLAPPPVRAERLDSLRRFRLHGQSVIDPAMET